MTILTETEQARLKELAQKAGIKIPAFKIAPVILSRKEIRRIEKALTAHRGEHIVLVKKKSALRVFSKAGHSGLVERGRQVGTQRQKNRITEALV